MTKMSAGRLPHVLLVLASAILSSSTTMASMETCQKAAESTQAWLILMIVVPAFVNIVSIVLIILTIVHVRRLKRITEAITSSTHWLTRTAVRVGIGPSAKKALLEYAKQKPELSKLVQVPNGQMAQNYAAEAQEPQPSPLPFNDHSPVEGKTLLVSELNHNMDHRSLFEFLGGSVDEDLNKVVLIDPSALENGIAMVTYKDEEQATEMLGELNFKEINDNRVLRASRYVKRDADEVNRRKDVIVKNIPRTMTNQELREMFTSAGYIVDAKKSENHPEHGYVQFEDAESAQKAIAQFSDTIVGGKTIKVEKFMSTDEYNENNLHVGNLSLTLAETDLRRIFGQFGAIRDLKIIENRGFGYVAFETKEAAVQAIDQMNNQRPFPDHAPLRVSKYIPKELRRRTFQMMPQENPTGISQQFANLYVGQLAATVNEERLTQLFAQYGSIRSTKVMRDNQGQPRGFGFVNFHRPEDAMRAIEALNNFDLDGRKIRVSVQKRNHDDQLVHSMQRMHLSNAPNVYQQPYPPQQYGVYQPYQQVPYGYAYAPQPAPMQHQYVYYQQPIPMQPMGAQPQHPRQFAHPPPPTNGPHVPAQYQYAPHGEQQPLNGNDQFQQH